MNKKQNSAKRIDELVCEIYKHRALYYNDSRPEISDFEYDALEKELNELQLNYQAQNSNAFNLLEEIGTKVINTGFDRLNHRQKMASLSKITDYSGYIFFLDGINRFLNINEYPTIIAELKFDGLSISLTYEMGILTKALTRGDGIKGEDVTKNIKEITDIPHRLNSKNPPRIIEIRGEIIMAKKDFADLNIELKKNNEQVFVSSRNAASGSLRQLDPQVTARRKLSFRAYTLGFSTTEIIFSQDEVLKQLVDWGMKTVEHIKVSSNVDDIADFVVEIENKRDELPFELDGIVCKINDIAIQNRLGYSARSPRWAIAWKFSQETEFSILKQIIFQISRHGHLTPVAVFEPVFIEGVKVTRASLHNISEIKKHDLRINDVVEVKRCGGIIPQVVKVHKDKRNSESRELILPTHCFSCKSLLDLRDGFLRCLNNISCQEQKISKIVFLVGRNGLDINGLGKKNIRLFAEHKFLDKPTDVFILNKSEAELKKIKGVGQKTLNLIFANIEKSKKVTFAKAIYCLAVPSFGSKLSQKLAGIFPNYSKLVEFITSDKSKELILYDGIGILNHNIIRNYFMNKENVEQADLLISMLDIKYSNHDSLKNLLNTNKTLPNSLYDSTGDYSVNKLAGKKVVFIGNLSVSRKEAKVVSEKAGAIVIDALNEHTDYLIVKENPRIRIEKAKMLGVEIINIDEWIKLILGNQFSIKGKNVNIIGDLSMSISDIKYMTIQAGARINAELNENTSYLVIGSYPEEIIELALNLNVKILDEADWKILATQKSSELLNKLIVLHKNLKLSFKKARELSIQAGASVKSLISSKTDYLVIQGYNNYKIKVVSNSNITILNIEEWKNIISICKQKLLENKDVIFVGKFNLSNEDIIDMTISAGAFITSINEATNYLLIGNYPKDSINKANSLGIEILEENDWQKMLSASMPHSQSKLYNKKIVFTGKLTMSRSKAQALSEQVGAIVVNSINISTDYLIAGEKPGSKIKIASKFNIPVLQEEDWKKMVS